MTRTFYFLPDGDVDTADWLAALNRERCADPIAIPLPLMAGIR